MKIGIISDTHAYARERCVVPGWVERAFEGVSLIIHAGDVEHPEYLNQLKKIAPVYAVMGNCDGCRLNNPKSININLGVGFLTAAHKAADARKALIEGSRVMVYGHTHIALINQENDLLVINPGSPTLPRAGQKPSVAVLWVEGDNVWAELAVK